MTDRDTLKILQNDVAQATAELSASQDQLLELFRDGTILQCIDPATNRSADIARARNRLRLALEKLHAFETRNLLPTKLFSGRGR